MSRRCTSDRRYGTQHRRCTAGVAVLLLLLAAACTTRNPVTGRPEVILMSEEQEKAIDEDAHKSIQAQLGVVRDEALATYIKAIGNALAVYSPRPGMNYDFDVVEMDEPNAFALPGGHIYVSRGLLLLANSEAEIANVLAHEIGHVAARHAAQRDAHMKTFGISTMLGNLASGSSAGSGEDARIGPGWFAAYSRDQESEADEIGQDLVVDAGIDPAGMATFLRSLENSTRLTQGFTRPETYFASHPATATRVVEADTRAQLRRWEPGFSIAATEDDYLFRIEGLAVGRPASEGIIHGTRFYHADLDFSLRYGDGWEIHNLSSQVIGVAPSQDALVVLEIQEPGRDPVAAAERFLREHEVNASSVTALRIGELDAARARGTVPTPGGRADAEVTWIAHDGNIFRLTAGTLSGPFRRYEGQFRSFPRSFRPLRPEDAELINDLRLRLVEALEGESLEELSVRVGNEWNVNELAVYNAMSLRTPLEAGQLIKVAIREPYVPEPRDEAQDASPLPESETPPEVPPTE